MICSWNAQLPWEIISERQSISRNFSSLNLPVIWENPTAGGNWDWKIFSRQIPHFKMTALASFPKVTGDKIKTLVAGIPLTPHLNWLVTAAFDCTWDIE